MKTCPTCDKWKSIIASGSRLLVEIRSEKVLQRKEFINAGQVWFCSDCGRALKREAQKHKEEILQDLIANCSSCQEKKKNGNSNRSK